MEILTEQSDFEDDDERTMDWLALVFLDPLFNEVKAQHIERFDRVEEIPNCKLEAEIIGRSGLYPAMSSGSIKLGRMMELTRCPKALRKIHLVTQHFEFRELGNE